LPFVELLSHLVNESMQGKPVASIFWNRNIFGI
jgi:hypothetical protein